MTVSGPLHVQTPIAGLIDLALRDPSLQQVVRRGSHVSEEEAWQNYQRENRRMSLSYVAIDAADF